ncbi:MAG TPA: protein translocase SEC61 complex subunit gamma [Candidatus Nanoarchaeia archaeon]|nr:protein translocase SEC61 complex subunit gamma [Candidatus Nanoarchaeia archaeon]
MEENLTKSQKVKRFIKETVRVLRITKKPNRAEFFTLCKVTGLGISIIGVIGFVILLLKELIL